MQQGQLWLMIACVVHVPLAIASLLPNSPPEREQRLWTGLCRAWWPVTIFLLISFSLSPGTWAAALALPWVLYAMACGLAVLFGATVQLPRTWHRILVHVAAVQFAGASLWVLAQRAGWEFLGFEEPWVTWTGAHFLVLGVSTLCIAAAAGRRFPPYARYRLMAVLLAFCFGVTALGIWTAIPWWERAGAWLTIVAVGWLAIELLMQRGIVQGWQRRALDLGALCVIGGMVLALAYTINVMLDGQWPSHRAMPEHGWPSLEFMVRWHAGLNTGGFATLSLLAFATRPTSAASVRSAAESDQSGSA